MKKSLIYLAGPYTHVDPTIMNYRYSEHCRIAAHLLGRGELIYSPISETVAIAKFLGETSWDFWREKDLDQLKRCDELYVILLDGYKQSLGVQGEVKFALQNIITISFIDPKELITMNLNSQDNVLKLMGVTRIDELND